MLPRVLQSAMRKSGRSGLDQEVNRSAPLAFTLDDLRREFLPQYLARGVTYANQGRVAGLRVSATGGLIEATVRGSDDYGVTIELSLTKDGRIRFDGFCDCPLARNCKHVAATLLTALEKSRAANETVEAVDPRIKRFFCRFSVAKTCDARNSQPMPPYPIAYKDCSTARVPTSV